MRALAELIMKGRAQAVIVAVLSTVTVLFAWVGAATVALVILRRGVYQGLLVMLWALLPAVLVAAWGDTGPLSGLLGSALVAVVLRWTVSWPLALCAAAASGLLTAAALSTIGGDYLAQALRLLTDMLVQVQSEVASSGAADMASVPMPSVLEVAGLLGLSNAFSVVLCVMLARWWQALLYNPGGFKQELHGLRLPPQVSVSLAVACALLMVAGPEFRFWTFILAVPLVFAGFCLIHAVADKRKMSSVWLVLFYFAWLLLDPLKAVVLLLAIADSWLNFRERLDTRR